MSQAHTRRAVARQGRRLTRIGLPLLIMLAMILPSVVIAAPANPAPAPAPAESAPAAAAIAPVQQDAPLAGTINGTVFRDYNANGTRQVSTSFNEPGVAGVVITAYDSGNVVRGTTTSLASGAYSLPVTGAGPYRVEFTLPNDGSLDFLEEGATSSVAGQSTNVRFVDPAGGTINNIDHGFNNPIDYSQANPPLVTAQTAFGPRNPVTNGAAAAEEPGLPNFSVSGSDNANQSVISLPYTQDGDISPTNQHSTFATLKQTGTLYGMIYQRQAQLVLAGTYFKSYADTGPIQTSGWLQNVDPMGAIYAVTPVALAGNPTNNNNARVYANLNKIKDPTSVDPWITGNPAGVDPRRSNGINYDINDCNGPVTTDPGQASPATGLSCWRHDPVAFDKVGAVALGDLEEDDTESFVFVTNLNDKKLYQLPIDPNPAHWPITTLAAPPVAIPNNCAVSADAVPGGLGFNDGKLYVGVTCTAKSTQDPSQLKAEVWRFDPVSQTFGGSPVFSLNLGYPRGCIFADNNSINGPKNTGSPLQNCQPYLNNSSNSIDNANWRVWPTDWTDMFLDNQGINGPGKPGWTTSRDVRLEYPHPWLSDITFDNNDLVLGFRDIGGDRTGNAVRSPNITTSTTFPGGMPQNSWMTQYTYTYYGAGFGDLLRACWNGSTWLLENNGTCGAITTPGANNGQGPSTAGTYPPAPGAGFSGYGEFYWDDSGPGSRNPAVNVGIPTATLNYIGHEQTMMGGIFQQAGLPDVAVTIADQFDYGTGGLARFSNVVDHPDITLTGTGNLNTAWGVLTYPLVLSDDNLATGNEAGLALKHTELYGDGIGFFAKANGLGDVEALTEPAPLEIGNYVWRDTNGNGRQDPGEAILSGVVVELWKDTNNDGIADTKVAQDTTDASGNYLFSSSTNPNNSGENWTFTGDEKVLTNTTYEIRILRTQTALTSTGYTVPTIANADAEIRDSDGVAIADTNGGGRSITGVRFTTGGPGVNDHTYDFGFFDNENLVSLGNQVWFDFNNDGLLNNGETGIDGVRVELYADSNADGRYTPGVDSFIDFKTTATVGPDAGIYNFTGLLPGDYVVVIPASNFGAGQPLNGMASSTGNNPTPDPDTNIDNDDNGYQVTPQGDVASLAITLESGSEPTGGGDENLTVDFGFFGLGAVGNYVWVDENSDGYQDEGEPGIPNVQINLYTSAGVFVGTTYTDSHGGYLFDNLKPGSYFVDVLDGTGGTAYSLPFPGMTQTPTNLPLPPGPQVNQDFGNQAHTTAIPTTAFTGYPVTIGGAAPLENLTADFGYNYNPANDVNNPNNPNPPSPNNAAVAALGDRVWIDSNGNGAQDPNEIGVGGAVVTLYYDPDGDGIYNTQYGGSTVTNADGYYMFDGLPPGAYVARVTDDSGATHNILNGGQYTQTGDPDHFGLPNPNPANPGNADNATTTPVLLGPGDVFLNADFGYQPTGATLGSIGDTIWFDANANGTGPSLPPFGGGSPVTQGNAGNPADPSEYGIPGVTVALIRDTNGNGQWDAGEKIIATTTTNASGQYLFPSLPINDGTGTDDYIVWVNDSNNVLGEMVPTYDKNGANPTAGLKTGLGISSVTNLGTTGGSPYGTDNALDQDFGYTNTYQQRNPQNTSQPLGLIGDYVWFDSNRDNIQDATESGVEGVLVELLNSTGTEVLATTRTDENGYYSFGGLPLNTSYIVNVPASNFAGGQPLEGTTNTGGPAGGSGNTGPVVNLTVANPINLVQDFGYAAPTAAQGSIGNQIWEDLNADGIRQGGEPAIAGVTVDLYRDLNGNGTVDPGEPLMGTQTTDANGQYLFSALPIVGGGDADAQAEYVVDVTDVNGVLAGYWHSLSPNQNANTGISGNTANDANDNSKVDPFAVEIGSGTGGQPVSNNLNVDFGYYVKPASLGNFVWLDDKPGVNATDGNGIQDPGEPGIDGILVVLNIMYPDGTSQNIVTVTGDDPNTPGIQSGWYSFGNLLLDEDYNASTLGNPSSTGLPKYTISVPNSGGYVPTLVDVGGPAAMDNSNPHSGTIGQATQGSTNVDQNSNPNAETNPIAGYDFGYTSTPLAVVLADFGAAAQTDHILVTWETVSEIDNAGFNLYRSTSDAAPGEQLASVASQAPGSAQGFSYSYQDFAVEAGQTYYYWLEAVDLNGSTSLNGPINATMLTPTAVTLSNVDADSGATNLLWLVVVAAGLALAAVYGLRRSAVRQ